MMRRNQTTFSHCFSPYKVASMQFQHGVEFPTIPLNPGLSRFYLAIMCGFAPAAFSMTGVGEPLIYHGYTLTTKLPFREVIQTIRVRRGIAI